MTSPLSPMRVAIAGASSLRARELAAVLEERSFPTADVRLLDDEVVEGTLTEAVGEPVVIQGMDDDSFESVRFAFFAGLPTLTEVHWRQAQRAGATVIDLTGALQKPAGAAPWIPALRSHLPAPRNSAGKIFSAPSSPAIVGCTLVAALREFRPRMAITFFQSVSERGQSGVEELEAQTVNLLSLKPFPTDVYDAQVAFNLLSSYGENSKARLSDARSQLAAEICDYLDGRLPAPAVQLIQAPVFYGSAFSAFVEFAAPQDATALERALAAAGVKLATSANESPSNVSVAGESGISLGAALPDANVANAYWLWGAADNMRLAASNAVSIAETLIAS